MLPIRILNILLFLTAIYSAHCASSRSNGKYKPCGVDAECVPYFLCQNGVIEKYGVNRLIPYVLYNKCTVKWETCCRKQNVIIDEVGMCGYQRVIDDRNKNGVTEFAEFPWIVAIFEEYTYNCVGTLISDNTVLTVAHCVEQLLVEYLTVRAGDWNIKMDDKNVEEYIHVERDVTRMIVHEKYDRSRLWNDVAILITTIPFTLTVNIQPICLTDSYYNFDNVNCFVAGWHKTNSPYILHKNALRIVAADQCQEILRSTILGFYFQLHESFTCAASSENLKDTCTGDGGSPLMCPFPDNKNRFYLAGLVSCGIQCNVKNVPGLYTNIPNLREWIRKQSNNFF